MTLRTSEEYRESLRDERSVVYRGATVDDVTKHTALARTIDHAGRRFEFPAEGLVGFWSYYDDELGEKVSTFVRRPVDSETLRARRDATEECTRRSDTTLNIVKVVGSDALFGLETVLPRMGSADAYRDRLALLVPTWRAGT